jgi:hypothetical protein
MQPLVVMQDEQHWLRDERELLLINTLFETVGCATLSR